MRTILHKIKIHPTTYFLFFLFLITGHIKNVLLIFFIILIHELGHIFFITYFKYSIDKVELLPFGGITKTTKWINTPIKQDIYIYIGGIFFQVLLYGLFFCLLKCHLIYASTYQMFISYNTTILIFNLLPIRPLDGGELCRLGLENYFSFASAQKIANITSLLFLFLFFLMNISFNLNNYLICSFLFVKIYHLMKNQHFIQNKFYVERLMYTFPYRRIHNEKKLKLQRLKKDTWHYFQDGNKMISEKKLLKEKFDIYNHF